MASRRRRREPGGAGARGLPAEAQRTRRGVGARPPGGGAADQESDRWEPGVGHDLPAAAGRLGGARLPGAARGARGWRRGRRWSGVRSWGFGVRKDLDRKIDRRKGIRIRWPARRVGGHGTDRSLFFPRSYGADRVLEISNPADRSEVRNTEKIYIL